MDLTYTIRRATVDDVMIITHQRRRMFTEMGNIDYTETPNMDTAYSEWLAPSLARGQYVGWLALDGSEVIGGTGAQMQEHPPMPVDLATQHMNLVNVYVEPDYRHRGIARALVQTALDWCRAEGIRVVTLHASNAGRPLYESLGFQLTNEMRCIIE